LKLIYNFFPLNSLGITADNHIYENSNATATNIGTVSSIENINHFSMEQAIKLFEELIKIERKKFESLKKEKE
jgi:hypothetical protein